MAKINSWKDQWLSRQANSFAPGEFITDDIVSKLIVSEFRTNPRIDMATIKGYPLEVLVDKLNALAVDSAETVLNKVLHLEKPVKLTDVTPASITRFLSDMMRASLELYAIDNLTEQKWTRQPRQNCGTTMAKSIML